MPTLNHNIRRHISAKRNGKFVWLCFTAEQSNSTVRLDITGSPDPVSLEVSRDGKTWTPYTWNGSTGATITLANVGDKVYWRNTVMDDSGTLSKSNNDFYQYLMSGYISASGNIQSLLRKDCNLYKLYSYCFFHLFYGCTSLVSAPALPATTLANNCYHQMLFGCTSLVSAPALPATSLANYCYYQMFRGCTSLVSAPALPATSLAISSYRQMFYGCTSLVSAPALPATSLANNCYRQMFYGCTSLNNLRTRHSAWLDSGDATSDWLFNVANTGTFYCEGLDDSPRNESHIPVGWNIVRPSDGYIQDGLVFQLDAKRLKTATTWTDIKGGVELAISGETATSTGLNFPKGYTIEVCERDSRFFADIKFGGPDKAYFYYRGPEYAVGPTPSGGQAGYYREDMETNEASKSMIYRAQVSPGFVTFSAQTTGQTVYANNQVMSYGVTQHTPSFTDNGTVIKGLDDIKSIRVYNRALTDAERLHNYQLDRERF